MIQFDFHVEEDDDDHCEVQFLSAKKASRDMMKKWKFVVTKIKIESK